MQSNTYIFVRMGNFNIYYHILYNNPLIIHILLSIIYIWNLTEAMDSSPLCNGACLGSSKVSLYNCIPSYIVTPYLYKRIPNHIYLVCPRSSAFLGVSIGPPYLVLNTDYLILSLGSLDFVPTETKVRVIDLPTVSVYIHVLYCIVF